VLQWALKLGKRPQNFEKCNFVAWDTVHIGSSNNVYIWRENYEDSGMAFRRPDCSGTDAYRSVVWSDIRVDAGRDWPE
jgi:hypothetical protein